MQSLGCSNENAGVSSCCNRSISSVSARMLETDDFWILGFWTGLFEPETLSLSRNTGSRNPVHRRFNEIWQKNLCDPTSPRLQSGCSFRFVAQGSENPRKSWSERGDLNPDPRSPRP